MSKENNSKIAELDEAIEKFKSQKRWSDAIRRIVAKSDLVSTDEEKISLLDEAAQMYVEKSNNQAEAIKCFEKILSLDENHQEAISQLKVMYEKRRDWEKLIRILDTEAESKSDEEQREIFIQAAQLGSEKIRKPELCIDLWQKVLSFDPEHSEALEKLIPLYERAKQWGPLAETIETLTSSEQNDTDTQQTKQLLQKLATVYGEKLDQNEQAIRALRKIIELDPEDKRSLEQLKRRLVADQAWEELEELLGGLDKWEELNRIFEREADQDTHSDDKRKELLFKVAEIWKAKLEKPERAVRALDKVIALDPENLEAADELLSIFDPVKDARKIAPALEIKLLHLSEENDKLDMLKQLGGLYADKLRQPEAAFEKFEKALHLEPDSEELQNTLESLTQKQEDLKNKLIDAFKKVLEMRPEQVSLRLKLALLLKDAGKNDEAVTEFQKVREEIGNTNDVLSPLAELYRVTSQFDQLAEVNEALLSSGIDEKNTQVILLELADINEKQLSKPDEAENYYRQLLNESEKTETEAEQGLIRVLEKQQKWDELSEELENQIAKSNKANEKHALFFKLAQTQQNHLSDTERAIEIYQNLLKEDLDFIDASKALEDLSQNESFAFQALGALSVVFDHHAKWDELTNILQKQAETLSPSEQQAALFVRAANLFQEQLDNPSKAYELRLLAIESFPSQSILLDTSQLATELDQLEPLSAFLIDLAEQSQSSSDKVLLFTHASRILSEDLAQIPKAIEVCEKALGFEDKNPFLLEKMASLYRKSEKWEEFILSATSLVEVSDDENLVENYLTQIAKVYQDQLSDLPSAIEAYRKLLSHFPQNDHATQSLISLFEQCNQWDDLVALLRQCADEAPDDERVRLLNRIGHIKLEKQNKPERAIETFEEVLALDPQNADAFSVLESLLDNPDFQARICNLLEPLYRENNLFENLAKVLNLKVNLTQDEAEKVDLLNQISELQEISLDNPTDAYKKTVDAFLLDPANEGVRERLERLASMCSEFESLASTYTQGASNAESIDVKISLLHRAAQLTEVQLERIDSATELLEQALKISPENLQTVIQLERLYQAKENFSDLAKMHLIHSDLLADLDEKKHLLTQAANIYKDVLEENSAAIETFLKAYEVDPDDLDMIETLIGLYRNTSQWTELMDFLKKKSENSMDEDARTGAFFEIGSLYKTQFNDSDQAIVYFQKASESAPTDINSLNQLHQLFLEKEQWDEVSQILNRKIELAENFDNKIQLQFELAELLDSKNQQTEQAVEVFKNILEMDSSHEPTIASLDAILKRGHAVDSIAEVLEPIYLQSENYPALISLLNEKVKHENDVLLRAELLSRIAELYQTLPETSDSGLKAFDYYLRSFKENANQEEVHGSLYALASEIDHWEALRSAYEEEISQQKTNDPTLASDIALRAAQIAEDQENNIEKAIELFQTVLGIEPEHLESLESLDRLFSKENKWDQLSPVLQKEIELTSDPDTIFDLKFRLGSLFIDEIGSNQPEKIHEGIHLFQEILSANPEYHQVVTKLAMMLENRVETHLVADVLEPYYHDEQDWMKLSHVNEIILSETADDEDKVRILQKLADIAETKLENVKGALAWFKRALIVQPENEDLIIEIERIAAQSEIWALACQAFADAANATEETETKKSLIKRLADVYEDQLQRIELAEETYRYLLSIDPHDEDALSSLDRIYSAHGANKALSKVLEKRVLVDSDPADTVERYFRLGQIFELELSQKDKAVECYKQIVDDLDDQHIDAIQSLANVYFEQEQWPNLLLAYQAELKASPSDDDQYQIYSKMGTLTDLKIGDQNKSIEYWNQALEVAGEDITALNALGNLHARSQNWEALADTLDRESVVEENEERRIQIFSDLALVSLHGNKNLERAIENYERIFDLQPQNSDPLIRIAAIQYQQNDFEEAIRTLERALESDLLEDTKQESNLHCFIGYIYFNQLKDSNGAIESYRKATELYQENFQGWDALDYLYQKQEQWDNLIEVYEQRVEILSDVQNKVQQLFIVAGTIEKHFEDPSQSESVYLRILDIEPLSPEAFETLQTRFKEEERWQDLISLYTNKIENDSNVENRLSLLYETFTIQREKLEDTQAAFDTAYVAWSQDYSNDSSIELLENITEESDRWADVLNAANEVLEQELEASQEIAICLCCAKWYGQKLGYAEYALPYIQKILETNPNHIQAIRYMRDSYLALEQWEELIQTLNFLVQIAEDPEEISDSYLLLGTTYEKNLSNSEQAFEHYQAAIEHHPHNLKAIDAIELFYEKSGEWDQFLQLLLNKINLVSDEDQLVDAFIKVAETYEDRFNDVENAAQYYKEAVKTNPERMEGIRGLERLYSRGDQWAELAQMLEEHVDAITEPQNQIRMLNQIANIWEEENNNLDKTLNTHRRILEIDPSHEPSYQAIERVHRAQKDWSSLVQVLDEHADLVSDLKEKKRLFKTATKIFTDELNDLDNAIDNCHRALDIDPNDPETLESLANIYEKQKDYEQAVDTLERLVDSVNNDTQRVQLLFKIGKLFDAHIQDSAAASDAYRRATTIDPNFAPALVALQNIYVGEQSWTEAAEVLEASIESQKGDNPVETSKLAAKLGQIAKEHLDDQVKSLENYELAFELDPTNIEAAFPLATFYFENAQFEKAHPIFKDLLLKSDQLSVADRQQLFFMSGKSASRLGSHDDSIAALQKAAKASPNDMEVAMELATAYHHNKDWLNASKIYQSLLVQHKDELEPAQVADLFFRLGLAKFEQKDSTKAIQMLEKALDAYPQHRPATEALVRIYEKKEDWKNAIEFRIRVLRGFIDDPEQQFKLMTKIGLLFEEKLGDKDRALQFYEEALSIKPEDSKLLHDMLATYQKNQDWKNAISVLEKISELNSSTDAKAKFTYTVGVIFRDQLKDIDSALAKFNEALDLDVGQLKAFEAINKILTERKDWKNLERSFRKMIHRIIEKDEKELEFNLWHNLGVIYRDRLNSVENAVEAFSMASNIKPDDETQRVILSELYALIPEKQKNAIEEHQWLLEKNPSRLKSYKALYRLYFDTNQYDKAWCVASALVFFKKADQEQENFFTQYNTGDVIHPATVINQHVWAQFLTLSEEDRLMTKLFEVLAPVVQVIKAKSDRSLHLQKKYLVKPEDATMAFARVYNEISKNYGLLIQPRLFAYPDAPGTGLRHKTGSQPAAIECGADLLSGFTPQEIGYATGYVLGYHRPETVIRTLVVNRDELKLILLAGLRMAGLDIADSSADATMKTLMDKMKPHQLDALKEAATQFIKAKSSVNIKTWLRCIDLAIARAAFVMSNNLSAAIKMLAYSGSETISYASHEEKVADLLKFSTSESYFQLRDTLGIKIKI